MFRKTRRLARTCGSVAPGTKHGACTPVRWPRRCDWELTVQFAWLSSPLLAGDQTSRAPDAPAGASSEDLPLTFGGRENPQAIFPAVLSAARIQAHWGAGRLREQAREGAFFVRSA